MLVWRYVRDGKGIGTVLHTEEVDADFSAPFDDAVSEEVGLGNHYYLWLFDLETGAARPIEGIGGSGRQFHRANFGGRTYVFLPYDSWSKTRIYEVDVENGTAELAADIPGWVYEWLRVR